MPTHVGNGLVVSQYIANPATNIILASTIAISSTTSLTIAATLSLVIIIIITAITKTYHFLLPFRLHHNLRHLVIALRRLLLLFM